MRLIVFLDQTPRHHVVVVVVVVVVVSVWFQVLFSECIQARCFNGHSHNWSTRDLEDYQANVKFWVQTTLTELRQDMGVLWNCSVTTFMLNTHKIS